MNGTSRIGRARAALADVIAEAKEGADLTVEKLKPVLDLLETKARRGQSRPPRRGLVETEPMTYARAQAIRAYKRQHPSARQADIARVFRTWQGSVSQILLGLAFAEPA